jgi:cell shape-determining protein MreC
VVVLALVIFLGLPLMAMIVIDDLKLRNEVRHEIRELKKLKKELHEKDSSVHDSVTSNGMP